PDAVRDGETGYVVGGRDVEALAERLIDLLTDDSHAKSMGEAGRAWVEKEWQWPTQAARLEVLLQGGGIGTVRTQTAPAAPHGIERPQSSHRGPPRRSR